MDLKMEIGENQILVFLAPSNRYSGLLEEIVVAASGIGNKLCYVSMNKPISVLSKAFKKRGVDVDKIIFIDCVGKVKEPGGHQVLYVSSPRALTELSISISKALFMKADLIILDSLSTILVYEEQFVTTKFAHLLASKMRIFDKKCIFICLEEDKDKEFMKNLSMFTDKIINLGKITRSGKNG